jgi:hypothetical protein
MALRTARRPSDRLGCGVGARVQIQRDDGRTRGHLAPRLPRPGDGGADGDLTEPAEHRGRFVDASHSLDERQPDLLLEVIGIGAAPAVATAQPGDVRPARLDELGHGPRIRARPGDEDRYSVVGHDPLREI